MSGYTDLTKLENSRNCLRRIARHDEPQFSKDSIVNVMERFVKTVKVMDDTILVPCRLMDRQVGDSTDIIPAPGKDSTSNQLTHGKRSAAHHSKNVHEFLTSSELFNLYNMLNDLKIDLLWTGKDDSAIDEDDQLQLQNAHNTMHDDMQQRKIYDMDCGKPIASTPPPPPSSQTTDLRVMGETKTDVSNAANQKVNSGHVRRPSTASVASIVSISNLSDSESDISQENDSGVESEGNKSDAPQSNSSSADSISSSEDGDQQDCISKKAANADKATELAKRCRRHLNGLYHCLEQMTEAANYLSARYQSDIGPV